MEGVKWEGCERCGEHLPAVMVHSLWLWPLSSLKMQDGERKREDEGVVVVCVWGGLAELAWLKIPPHFHLPHSSNPLVDRSIPLLTTLVA